MKIKVVVFAATAALCILLTHPFGAAAQTHPAGHEGGASVAERTGGREAPLFDDLGGYQHPITTTSPQAQRYFNQGLTLAYGFNHGEAIRSFKEAARLDPGCAMCHWGVALAHGPNINLPMQDEAVPQAWEALQQAKRLAPKASEREQAYIRALEARYAARPVPDRSALDLAYADAMREVARRYPDDPDAATLFAEALMDTMPWDYYMEDRRPKPVTDEVLKALESVIARHPEHPGANHFYIHAVEASPYPERALPSAYRLGRIAPGAGHLVHMPSHIYLRVGRYHDASLANERAVTADQSYIAQCRAQGFYPAAYYPHNQHFLWYTSGMEGRGALAIGTAREMTRMNAAHSLAEGERFRSILILTLARFGKWGEVLAEPRPAAEQLYATAMWHYARGLAHAALRQFDAAARELDALERIAQSDAMKPLEKSPFHAASLIRISRHALAGELANGRGQADEMRRQFTEAVRIEDSLPYTEPPYWHHPVRQSYGAALLAAGRASEAEAAYREDLRRHPANGWSLYGLLQSLRAQGRSEEAAEVERRFRQAWGRADVTLTASRL